MIEQKNPYRRIGIYLSATFFLLTFVYSDFYPEAFSGLTGAMQLDVLGAFSWLTLAMSIFTWRKSTRVSVDLYPLMLSLFYLFTMVHCLVDFLGLLPQPSYLEARATESQILHSSYFTLRALILMHLGALISARSWMSANLDPVGNNKTVKPETIRKAGFVIVAFSGIAFFYNLYSVASTAINQGYGAMFGYEQGIAFTAFQKLLMEVENFFLPGMLCLLAGYRHNRKAGMLIFGLVLIYIVTMLIVGSRLDAVNVLLCFLYAYHAYIQRITRKNIIVLLLAGLVLLLLMPIIGEYRNYPQKNLTSFLKVIQKYNFISLIRSITDVFTATQHPLILVIENVPRSSGFLMGMGYVYALTLLVPNLGFWAVHPAMYYTSGGEWLRQLLGLRYGPGFSLMADAYRNYGEYGIWVFILFGSLFGMIFSGVPHPKADNYNGKTLYVLIYALTTMMVVRNEITYLIRTPAYVLGVVYLLVLYFGKHEKKLGA